MHTNVEHREHAGQPQSPGTELRQLVSFRLGGEEFGLDVLHVQEIIRVQQLTRVPNAPRFIEGVINVRGQVIPVIALRRRLALEDAAPTKDTRIIVVEAKGMMLGLMVDAVSEVMRIPPSVVGPPPRLSRVDREYVAGIGKMERGLLIVLDLDRMIAGSELLSSSAAAK